MKKKITLAIIIIAIISIATLYIIYNSKEIEKDEFILQSIELCKSEGNSKLCMPDQNWRCTQGEDPTDGCGSLINQINELGLSVDYCYELEYPNLISYCLGKIDINKCFEYSQDRADARRMCYTIDCQRNREEYEDYLNLSSFMDERYCLSIFSYGISNEDCEYYFDNETTNDIWKENCIEHHK
jgi:hypothetical protein